MNLVFAKKWSPLHPSWNAQVVFELLNLYVILSALFCCAHMVGPTSTLKLSFDTQLRSRPCFAIIRLVYNCMSWVLKPISQSLGAVPEFVSLSSTLCRHENLHSPYMTH